MMNKFLRSAFLMLACGCISGYAQTYSYVNLVQADATVTQVDASDLEITFADGQLTATTNSGAVTIDLSSMDYLEFSDTEIVSKLTDGVSATEISESSVAEVYSVDGVRLAQGSSVAEALSNLRPGLYVVRQGSRTFKTVKK